MKITCDICKKEIPILQYGDGAAEKIDIIISSRGVTWDICSECKADLWKWMSARRAEFEVLKATIEREE